MRRCYKCTQLLKQAENNTLLKLVTNLDANEGDVVTFDKVVFVSGDEPKVGTPYVEGAKVEAKVLAQAKAKKVIVYKYKSKKNERKKNGHRQPYTLVEISGIN